MSDRGAKDLIDLGNRLFVEKLPLDSLNQEIAWQFSPDLADFTSKLMLGDDWASDRMDGFPEQVSRELANNLSAMLRPKDRPWFKTTTQDDEIDADEVNARYLEYVTNVMRRAIYDPRTKFVRATKECDRFYVNFGMGVISIEEARERTHLFYRNHHLRDCAWLENDLGDVDHLHRKDPMTARAILSKFAAQKDNIDPVIKRAAEKEPGKEFDIRVVVLPSDEYNTVKEDSQGSSRYSKRLPFVICYIDADNGKIIRESPMAEFCYVVPRWHRFARSQYAFSPAAMPALADARMAQMLNQILLEAGEKAIDPPMIGKQEVVMGEPNLQAGGLSWVDLQHDANLKEALDVIKIDADMSIGFEMRKDLREMLAKSFFLDKLTLPESGSQMTAFEVSRRLEEHVRNLLPLFEPMEIEYNSRLLEKTFMYLRNMNAFDIKSMPETLAGADITWTFESPIQQAQQMLLVEQYKGSLEMIALGSQAGASSNPMNIDKALRDALRGVGGPATWRKSQAEQDEEARVNAMLAQVKQAATAVAGGAGVAGMVGEAGEKLIKGGMLPAPPPPPEPGEEPLTMPAPTTEPISPAGNPDAYGLPTGL